MAKQPTKKELLMHAYNILHKNWPKITKKLGLREDSFLKPDIKFTSKCPEYDEGLLKISYPNTLKSCKDKKSKKNGLEIKYKDILEDEIIHECIHYIQDQFYDVEDTNYSYASEGLASLVSIQILLENKSYNLPTTEITDYFIEAKKEYKNYFHLPKKYDKHIEDIIKEGSYKPPKRDLTYAKGLTHICENYKKMKNYLDLLIQPFENSEIEYVKRKKRKMRKK